MYWYRIFKSRSSFPKTTLQSSNLRRANVFSFWIEAEAFYRHRCLGIGRPTNGSRPAGAKFELLILILFP